MDQRFALRRPSEPVRIPQYAQIDLPEAERYPLTAAINTTSKALVISVLNAGGTAYEWRNADGSVL